MRFAEIVLLFVRDFGSIDTLIGAYINSESAVWNRYLFFFFHLKGTDCIIAFVKTAMLDKNR